MEFNIFKNLSVPVIIIDGDFKKGPHILYANSEFIRVFPNIKIHSSIRPFITYDTFNIRLLREILVRLKKGKESFLPYRHFYNGFDLLYRIDIYPNIHNNKIESIIIFFNLIDENSNIYYINRKRRIESSLIRALEETNHPIPKLDRMNQILTIIEEGILASGCCFVSIEEKDELSIPFIQKCIQNPKYKSQYYSHHLIDSQTLPELYNIILAFYHQPHARIHKIYGNNYTLFLLPIFTKEIFKGTIIIVFQKEVTLDTSLEIFLYKFQRLISNYLERYYIRRELEIYLEAFRQIQEGILITDANLEPPSPKILYANEYFLKMTGYELSEIMGKSPRIFQGAKTNKEVLKNLKDTLQKGKSFFSSTVNYKKNGEEYIVRWNIHPIKDKNGTITHFLSIQRDITEDVKVEKKLQKRFKYEIAQASISQLLLQPYQTKEVIEDSLDTLILFMNISFCCILEYYPSCPIDQDNPLIDLHICHIRYNSKSPIRFDTFRIPGMWLEQLKNKSNVIAYKTSLNSQNPFFQEYPFDMVAFIPFGFATGRFQILAVSKQNPEEVWEEEDILILKTFSHLIETYQDRQQMLEEIQTHRSRLEELVKEKTASLEIALQKAELANKAKSDFLANMTHELRTPLNSIIGFSKIIEVKEENPDNKKYLEYIYKSGTHLLNLINDILDLSKIESGKFDLQLVPCSICQSLEFAIDSLHPQATKKNLQILKNHYSNDLKDIKVLAEEKRLCQIFLNILSNAIKFSFPNTTIEVNLKKLKPNPKEQDTSFVEVSIKNYGIGIRNEDMEKIFDKFTQLKYNPHDEIPGTGLGLSITKALVEKMGGKIFVHSEFSKFAEFFVQFPIYKNLKS